MPKSTDNPPIKRPPRVGDAAPDFSLTKLNGRPANLAQYAHKPLVLIFGSYTAPTFRQHAAAYDDLKKVGGFRCGLLIVYTREAYPAGVWEIDRNRDAGIRVPPHADAAARQAAAEKARDDLKLTLDIAPDDMDDTVTNLYGGFPNAAVAIDRDGKVALRQRWADPFGLKEKIEELLKT